MRLSPVGKSDAQQEDENREVEKLCKQSSNLAKHNCEGQAVLSTAEEEDHRVQCVDDIKSQVLPWSAVCQALEQELKVSSRPWECIRKLKSVMQS